MVQSPTASKLHFLCLCMSCYVQIFLDNYSTFSGLIQLLHSTIELETIYYFKGKIFLNYQKVFLVRLAGCQHDIFNKLF